MTATVVHAEDWMGLYVDGQLRWEGHRITPEQALEEVGIKAESIRADDAWLDEAGGLPDLLAEVVAQPGPRRQARASRPPKAGQD